MDQLLSQAIQLNQRIQLSQATQLSQKIHQLNQTIQQLIKEAKKILPDGSMGMIGNG